MALYNITVGGLPQASDLNQLVDVFKGTHDIGTITFAPTVVAPTTTGFSLVGQAGSTLGVGAYNYQFTYVTGYYKSDGTLVLTGETTVSPSLAITTASANTTVKVTLPVPAAASVVATRIYRTAVGGATYGLIATVKDGTTIYTDSTADASRGAAPPGSNTTGTRFGSLITGDLTVKGFISNNGQGNVSPNYIERNSPNPNLYINQLGTGVIADFQVAGVSKASISNSGVFVSNVATGTAPFTVASTTKVTNLNADLLDGIDSAGFTQQTSQSATLPATAGWYRIAQSASSIARNAARFELDWTLSGVHGQATFNAGIMYGNTSSATINQVMFSNYVAGHGITQARIVYHTTYSGNYAYLEVYNAGADAITLNVQMISALGWSLISPNTAGSIPAGYTSYGITFYDGISTDGQIVSAVATGTAPLIVASTTKVTNLNADLVDGYNFNQALQTTDSPSFNRLTSTVATGTAPFTVTSTTAVANLNADMVDGYHMNQGVQTTDSPTFVGGLIKASTNGTTTFQVQDSSANPVFNVDTTNQRVGVNTNMPATLMHVFQDANADGIRLEQKGSANWFTMLYMPLNTDYNSAVWYWNGSAFADQTPSANVSLPGQSQVLPSAIGHYLYIGNTAKVTRQIVDIITAGVNGVIAWEYWNGTAWTTLNGVTPTGNNFSSDATFTFIAPADWTAKAAVSNSTPFMPSSTTANIPAGASTAVLYWIRAKVTVAFTTGATYNYFTPSPFTGNAIGLNVAGSTKFTVNYAGGIATGTSLFWTAAMQSYGLNLNNSDIIGANNIVMNDEATSDTEGMQWLKSGKTSGSTDFTNDYDTLRVLDGQVFLNSEPVITGARGTLWSGGYYLTDTQTITPSKSLSQCANGWILVWSDYDASTSTANNFDFDYTYIPKNSPALGYMHNEAIGAYVSASTDTIITKAFTPTNTTITGNAANSSATTTANDVVLRYVLEY
jgi:hypothetical protein